MQNQSKHTYTQYLQQLLKENSISFKSKEQFQLMWPSSLQGNQLNNQLLSQQNFSKFQTNFTTELTGQLASRYCRQMLLKQIGFQGQQRIIKTKVAIVGSGGIGCPTALYLAGAGIGTIGLFDSDTVDVSNLHRQIGHKQATVGVKKTTSLKRTLLQFNPFITVIEHEFVTVKSARQLNGYDLVIDGSDNPQCRYIVNDYCMKRGCKLLSGACIGWEAQITCYGNSIKERIETEQETGKEIRKDKQSDTSVDNKNPCYRCIWGDNQKTSGGCSTMGVVGMLPGLVGIILATEALKMILNGGVSSLQGSLLTYEARTATFRKMKLRNRLENCTSCGTMKENKLKMEEYDYSQHAICKPDFSNLPEVQSVTWEQLLQKQDRCKIRILDVRPESQYKIAHLKNMISLPYQQLAKHSQSYSEKVSSLLAENWQKQETVFVSCTGGVMSRKGADILNKLGYKAINVKGGINQYARKADAEIPLL